MIKVVYLGIGSLAGGFARYFLAGAVYKRKEGLAGATVLKGFMGFGRNSRIHTTKLLRLSEDLPVIVEIVDNEEKINGFLPHFDEMVKEGLVTVEKANVILYRSNSGSLSA